MSKEITTEMRDRASKQAKFNLLFVSDGDSRLSPMRGEIALNTFSKFYTKVADVTYMTAPSSRLKTLTANTLGDINVIWLDNIRGFAAIKAMSQLQDDLMELVEPSWKETAKAIDSEEERIKYIDTIVTKRRSKVRIIYAIDEFVWEAPIGRACDIQTVQLIESAMSLSDTIVTPNADLAEAMVHFKFLSPDAEIISIKSTANTTFFQLHRDYMRKGKAEIAGLRDKPKVLVKGLVIPENIQKFIYDNYKKMDITISSVGEVDPFISARMGEGKINHIMHWASPHVTNRTLLDTYAIERDGCYDVVILTKPEQLQGEMYEITTGDEDMLFAIFSGAIPICGTKDIGYDDKHLSNASGLTFGASTSPKSIRLMVESVTSVPVKFNEVYGKCRDAVQRRIINDDRIMGTYYSALLGKYESELRQQIAKEASDKSKAGEKQIDVTTSDVIETTPTPDVDVSVDDKVIEVNFQKGNV